MSLVLGPTGVPYYYNTITQESSYQRPMPTFAMAAQLQSQKKKEKPLVKTPIPGTGWIRVITTEGNTFYTHKEKKQSVWTVPEEIKAAVSQLEREEVEKKAFEQREAQRKQAEAAAQAEVERLAELERIKAEVEVMVKKRPNEDMPVDEVTVSKKPRVEDASDDDDGDDGEESEEEEWQREAAAQLAAEAEEERKRQEEEQKQAEEEARRAAEEAEEAKRKQINMPNRVDISIEEGKALFKVRSSHYSSNPAHTFLADVAARKGYQSSLALGHFPPPLRVRSSLRPIALCKRAERSL
jgi:hypothetical protein